MKPFLDTSGVTNKTEYINLYRRSLEFVEGGDLSLIFLREYDNEKILKRCRKMLKNSKNGDLFYLNDIKEEIGKFRYKAKYEIYRWV